VFNEVVTIEGSLRLQCQPKYFTTYACTGYTFISLYNFSQAALSDPEAPPQYFTAIQHFARTFAQPKQHSSAKPFQLHLMPDKIKN
jgi:hypothetical protein